MRKTYFLEEMIIIKSLCNHLLKKRFLSLTVKEIRLLRMKASHGHKHYHIQKRKSKTTLKLQIYATGPQGSIMSAIHLSYIT